MPTFTHLHVHTPFSFLRGASSADELFQTAKAQGHEALGITDINTLSGIVRAFDAAREYELKLLVGSRVTFVRSLSEAPPEDPLPLPLHDAFGKENLHFPYSILLYPENILGYKNLCSLLSRGKLRTEKGKCLLVEEDLFDFSKHLLCVVVIEDRLSIELESRLETLKELFNDDRLSLSISHVYTANTRRQKERAILLSKKLLIPLVATNEILSHTPERKKLQDVLTCIRNRTTLKEAGFLLQENSEKYLKPPAEMCRLFRHLPNAIQRTQEIKERIKFSLSELRYEYPKEVTPKGETPKEYLRSSVYQGAKKRYPLGLPKSVEATIEKELNIISELSYEKYFLTVYAIVQFAQSRNILCQGRGAAANSAVCYCLGITAVDPEKIKLLFERFISKERKEPPDIDIDFEHERREEVIQYIYQTFGRHRAALTAEVVTYRRKSAVRDVGKVFGLTPGVIEKLSRLLLYAEGKEISKEAFEKVGLSGEDTAIKHTLALSKEIRGFPRHLSQHVGGFVISDPPLSELVPIENATMAERTVIEWDKDDIESMGMLKIDVLALGMLTCIRKAFEMINNGKELHQALLLHNIPPDDPEVYDMLCKADSIGVFQVESRAQMSMLPRLKPRCFYDLVVEVAIVRPGPIQGGMVHPYLRRRMGKEPVTYPSEAVKEILKNTLGVPIFQEQVMEIAIEAAGFSPDEADALRRAMASWKKDKGVMATFGARIIQGMQKKGYSMAFAKQFIEQMKGFSEYGFPQSHAASFALLVYVSSWIKKHEPAVFAAALINSQPMGFYQPAQIIEDAQRHGVWVREIDVHKSEWDCTVIGEEKNLQLGFRLIKGISRSEIIKIKNAIKRCGTFSSLRSLWKESSVSIKTLKLLAQANALSSLGLTRQRALWELKTFKDSSLPLLEIISEKPSIEVTLPNLSALEQVFRDYQTFGLSLKAHPISFIREKIAQHNAITAHALKHSTHIKHMSHVIVCGMVLVRQRPMTASGIVFMTVEDETGSMNFIVKPEVFKKYQSEINESVFILVRGRAQKLEGVVHVLVEEVKDISSAFRSFDSMSRDFH